MTALYRDIGLQYWLIPTSGKFSAVGASLADRHYNRRKVGSPQFMPPGQTIVLIGRDDHAVFGWWRPHPSSGLCAMNGLDGWTCTIFRNESPLLSSTLILDAERAIKACGYGCGPDGLLSYVDIRKVRSVNPGYCFLMAGWQRIGWSADHKKRLLQKAFGDPRQFRRGMTNGDERSDSKEAQWSPSHVSTRPFDTSPSASSARRRTLPARSS